jgi:hypothetical protein
VNGPTEIFSEVLTVLPLPFSWAAAIAANPTWTVQTTTRYIVVKCYEWLQKDRAKAAIGPILKFLMGAATPKTPTANKSNPRVMFNVKPVTLDTPGTAFVTLHKAGIWEKLVNKPRRAKKPKRHDATVTKLPPQETQRWYEQPATQRGAKRTAAEALKKVTDARKALKFAESAYANQRKVSFSKDTEQAPPNSQTLEQQEDVNSINDEQQDEIDLTESDIESPKASSTREPSFLTPELIIQLRDHPAALSAVVTALVQNERNKIEEQNNLASSLAAVNAVTKAAIAAASETNGSTTAKGKWNPAKQARFAAYSGRNVDDPDIPEFWGHLVAAASDDKEAVIQALLNELAETHDCFQSWTPPPHFSEDMKKLLLRPAMTEKQFFRGLSPLAFADRDQTEIQLANEQRKLQADYTLQLTAGEAAKLEAKAPPMPRTTEKLQLYLKRWILFLDKVFGKKCELVIQGRQFYRTLQAKLPRIMSTGDFMDRRGNSILWELAIATEAFFRQIVSMAAFNIADEDPGLPTPKATCVLMISDILTLHGPQAGDLPVRLQQYRPPTAPPNNTNHNPSGHNTNNTGNPSNDRTRDRRGGPNTNTSTKKGNWPTPFQSILGGYAPPERSKFSLKGILIAADKSRDWLLESLGLTAHQCCSTVVFGQCPPHCRLKHDAVVDTAKADMVSAQLLGSIKRVATERNIKRA